MAINMVLICTDCSASGGQIPLAEVSQVRTVSIPENLRVGDLRPLPAVRIDTCKHIPARTYNFTLSEVGE
jgi:hypothetical protein